MQKLCRCGHKMEMRLRTIVYSNKVEIDHVPVLSCQQCHVSELHPMIKNELTSIIRQLGNEPAEQKLEFNEMNELAHLMLCAENINLNHSTFETLIDGRINELLDLLLLARSLQDEAWMEDIRRRLTQITNFAMNTA